VRQRGHNVEQRDEARRLHRHPSDLAGDIPAGIDGCFAHRVPGCQPLE